MVRKRKNLEARSNQLCRFFKQGECTQGVSCLMSHDAKMQQREIGTEVAFDIGFDGNTVTETTASGVEG